MTTTALPDRGRISARVPLAVQQTLEAAASLTGSTLNQFIVQTALREAERVIEQERIIRLSAQDTERVLYEVFVRLYTLRNQLMHGGATWNSSVNRAQVRDGRALLARVLPVMLGVMMDKSERFEGQPFYPVVKDGALR